MKSKKALLFITTLLILTNILLTPTPIKAKTTENNEKGKRDYVTYRIKENNTVISGETEPFAPVTVLVHSKTHVFETYADETGYFEVTVSNLNHEENHKVKIVAGDANRNGEEDGPQSGGWRGYAEDYKSMPITVGERNSVGQIPLEYDPFDITLSRSSDTIEKEWELSDEYLIDRNIIENKTLGFENYMTIPSRTDNEELLDLVDVIEMKGGDNWKVKRLYFENFIENYDSYSAAHGSLLNYTKGYQEEIAAENLDFYIENVANGWIVKYGENYVYRHEFYAEEKRDNLFTSGAENIIMDNYLGTATNYMAIWDEEDTIKNLNTREDAETQWNETVQYYTSPYHMNYSMLENSHSINHILTYDDYWNLEWEEYYEIGTFSKEQYAQDSLNYYKNQGLNVIDSNIHGEYHDYWEATWKEKHSDTFGTESDAQDFINVKEYNLNDVESTNIDKIQTGSDTDYKIQWTDTYQVRVWDPQKTWVPEYDYVYDKYDTGFGFHIGTETFDTKKYGSGAVVDGVDYQFSHKVEDGGHWEGGYVWETRTTTRSDWFDDQSDHSGTVIDTDTTYYYDYKAEVIANKFRTFGYNGEDYTEQEVINEINSYETDIIDTYNISTTEKTRELDTNYTLEFTVGGSSDKIYADSEQEAKNSMRNSIESDPYRPSQDPTITWTSSVHGEKLRDNYYNLDYTVTLGQDFETENIAEDTLNNYLDREKAIEDSGYVNPHEVETEMWWVSAVLSKDFDDEQKAIDFAGQNDGTVENDYIYELYSEVLENYQISGEVQKTTIRKIYTKPPVLKGWSKNNTSTEIIIENKNNYSGEVFLSKEGDQWTTSNIDKNTFSPNPTASTTLTISPDTNDSAGSIITIKGLDNNNRLVEESQFHLDLLSGNRPDIENRIVENTTEHYKPLPDMDLVRLDVETNGPGTAEPYVGAHQFVIENGEVSKDLIPQHWQERMEGDSIELTAKPYEDAIWDNWVDGDHSPVSHIEETISVKLGDGKDKTRIANFHPKTDIDIDIQGGPIVLKPSTDTQYASMDSISDKVFHVKNCGAIEINNLYNKPVNIAETSKYLDIISTNAGYYRLTPYPVGEGEVDTMYDESNSDWTDWDVTEMFVDLAKLGLPEVVKNTITGDYLETTELSNHLEQYNSYTELLKAIPTAEEIDSGVSIEEAYAIAIAASLNDKKANYDTLYGDQTGSSTDGEYSHKNSDWRQSSYGERVVKFSNSGRIVPNTDKVKDLSVGGFDSLGTNTGTPLGRVETSGDTEESVARWYGLYSKLPSDPDGVDDAVRKRVHVDWVVRETCEIEAYMDGEEEDSEKVTVDIDLFGDGKIMDPVSRGPVVDLSDDHSAEAIRQDIINNVSEIRNYTKTDELPPLEAGLKVKINWDGGDADPVNGQSGTDYFYIPASEL